MRPSVVYIAPYFDEKLAADRGENGFRSPASCAKIAGIAAGMAQSGADVTIVSPILFSRRSLRFHPRREGNVGGVRIIYTSCMDFPMLNLLWAVLAVVLELSKSNANKVVFYNFYMLTALPAYVIKLVAGIPLVVDYEDGHFADPERSRLAKIIHYVLERLGDLLVSGAILAAPTLHERLKTRNICVCRGFYVPFPEYGPVGDKPLVVFSGRLDHVRGIDVFLDAATHVNGMVKFIVTGYGPLRDWVEVKIRQMKADGVDIIFQGFLSNIEISALISSATILVNPQRTDNPFARYSFPSKLCTYMSSGAVVLSSAVSDITSFAEGRLLLYEKDCPRSLAKLIDHVLVHPELYASYGQSARLWIEQQGSLEAVARKLESVLNQA